MSGVRSELEALIPLFDRHVPAVPQQATQPLVNIAPFVRSIARRIEFAKIHLAALSTISWPLFERVGTHDSTTDDPVPLVIDCRTESIKTVIRCRETATNFVYIAFDGIVSGCVNATDTLVGFSIRFTASGSQSEALRS